MLHSRYLGGTGTFYRHPHGASYVTARDLSIYGSLLSLILCFYLVCISISSRICWLTYILSPVRESCMALSFFAIPPNLDFLLDSTCQKACMSCQESNHLSPTRNWLGGHSASSYLECCISSQFHPVYDLAQLSYKLTSEIQPPPPRSGLLDDCWAIASALLASLSDGA